MSPLSARLLPGLLPGLALTFLLGCGGSDGSPKADPPPPPLKAGAYAIYTQTVAAGTETAIVLHAVSEDGTRDTALATFTGLGGSWAGRAGDRLIYSEQVGETDTTELWRHLSIRLDGLGRTLLSGTSTDWNSNALIAGSRVILQKGTTGELYTVPADGSRPPEPFSLPGRYAGTLQALGDGVLYQEQTEVPGTDAIRFRPADASAPPVTLYLRTATAQETFRGVFGDRVLYSTNTTLGSVRLDGTGAKTLATVPRFLSYLGVAGSQVVYTQYLGPASELWTVPLDGATAPFALDATPGVQSFNSPVGTALAEGGQLVYGRIDLATPTRSDLFSVPLAGGTPRKLTALAENELPKAVLDGQAYFQITVGGSGMNLDLYRVPLDGSAPEVPVAQTAQLEMFLGLLEGRLLFFRRFDDREELRSVTADGGDERLLATSPASQAGRPWAGILQGRVYVYLEGPVGAFRLSSLRADGTDLRDLVTTPTDLTFEGVL